MTATGLGSGGKSEKISVVWLEQECAFKGKGLLEVQKMKTETNKWAGDGKKWQRYVDLVKTSSKMGFKKKRCTWEGKCMKTKT